MFFEAMRQICIVMFVLYHTSHVLYIKPQKKVAQKFLRNLYKPIITASYTAKKANQIPIFPCFLSDHIIRFSHTVKNRQAI